jgi:predicted peroxiredoxin
MPDIIATALITQEQMNIDTAFDFICMVGMSMNKEQYLCIISPQRARKEIAKREAIGIAARENCKSILFIRDGVRFVPEILNKLTRSGKQVVGCRTSANAGMINSDLLLVEMDVFGKLKKPYFATDYKENSIDTIPDYMHFFKNCENVGIKSFCDESLSSANNAVKCVSEGEIKVNARYIAGGNPKGKIIAIAFPSYDLIYTHTASDIAQMVATNIGIVKGFVIINAQSDEIETARNISVAVAKSEKAEQILFIDSDMRLPDTALLRMLRRNKQIIGVNAAKRAGEGKPIFHKNLFGKPFNYKKGDTEQVHFIGMGVTLIDMAVFEKMDKPYFYPNYQIDSDEWRGEDYVFCYEARQKGFSIWCDVGLSKEIGHIGANTYYLRK